MIIVMKSYPKELREKIVTAHLKQKISIRQVAIIFSVTKSLVQKLVKQHKIDGNLEPLKRGKPRFSHLTNADLDLKQLVSEHPDATLAELCELFEPFNRKLGKSYCHVSSFTKIGIKP